MKTNTLTSMKWQINKEDGLIWADNKEGGICIAIYDGSASYNSDPIWANSEDQINANGKLIAAAPELLKALQSLVGMEAWIGDKKMKELFQSKVYAAIQKATE